MNSFDDYLRSLPRVRTVPPAATARTAPAFVPDPPDLQAHRETRHLLARVAGPLPRWPRPRRWQLVLAGGVVAAALLLQFAFDAEMLGRGAELGRRVAAVQTDAASLRADVDRRLALQQQRMAEGEKVLGQSLLPPPTLARADQLAAAGRLREAEAAWARFLWENPASPLTAAVLERSALAAMALGDCRVALSRRAQLQALEPRHPLLAQRQAWGGCPAAPGR